MKKVTLKEYNRAKEIVQMYESQITVEGDSVSLDECNLSVRTINGLWSMDFRKVGDVRRFYEKHGGNSFYRIRNIGRKSIEEIRLLLNIPYEIFHKSIWEVK